MANVYTLNVHITERITHSIKNYSKRDLREN